ncbi:MAG: hydantoinase B/oxoprolinase family protein, partial [Lewinella sp.]|nr:hydantoinase B/oxoprolinase family protein [Lewinella sp.]
DRVAAEAALRQVQERLRAESGHDYPTDELLRGYERIANEKMAEAIRRISVAEGFDPRDYALLAFGGAGGVHACAIADILHMDTVILPRDAGLLSAYGMGRARVERLVERQVLQLLDEVASELPAWLDEMTARGAAQLAREGLSADGLGPARVLIYCRFRGQETPLELRYEPGLDLARAFAGAYEQLFGHLPENLPIEVESIKVFVATASRDNDPLPPPGPGQPLAGGAHRWEQLTPGSQIAGPAILMGDHATAYLPEGWDLTVWPEGHLVAKRAPNHTRQARDWGEAIELELFTNRFRAIADEMGAQLQRTAFSLNVKERLDFSCAILDADARLLVNAPHIPVHLGSLGICARLTLAAQPLGPGDVAIVNHPKYGGSHLPDITLLQGVFTDEEELIGYVINRAHHAEVGGSRPGSMPPDATTLAEEGVVFPPTLLVISGEVQWEAIREKLTGGPYPSRAVTENLADLNAALASLHSGERALRKLVASHGLSKVHHYMEALQASAHRSVQASLQAYRGQRLTAEEQLDDGHTIRVTMAWEDDGWTVDFNGSAGVHPGNLNANLSIVYSALVYVLRLLCEDDLPLNEGLLRGVKVIIPPNCFLHPDFEDDPARCPAVVGGNTEVSQRLVDTLLKALGLAAASQGTMNNFLFGNDDFGYYETIGGGVGAGPGFHGRSGVHQHMTNTRITDPEDLERVFPVRLHRFALRKGSGGEGKWRGGDGLIREVEALVPLEVTLLTQRRAQGPYGMAGGQAGQAGRQWLIGADDQQEQLPGIVSVSLSPGERLRLETPGGGGWGE